MIKRPHVSCMHALYMTASFEENRPVYPPIICFSRGVVGIAQKVITIHWPNALQRFFYWNTS